ncbi:MAG: hypothetical protein LBR19_04175 [Bifidobacteriaceae bacterium]|jgi:hypothetical protein|nr:hypothetical protein [Bifidobacteriaceae bacterium]
MRTNKLKASLALGLTLLVAGPSAMGLALEPQADQTVVAGQDEQATTSQDELAAAESDATAGTENTVGTEGAGDLTVVEEETTEDQTVTEGEDTPEGEVTPDAEETPDGATTEEPAATPEAGGTTEPAVTPQPLPAPAPEADQSGVGPILPEADVTGPVYGPEAGITTTIDGSIDYSDEGMIGVQVDKPGPNTWLLRPWDGVNNLSIDFYYTIHNASDTDRDVIGYSYSSSAGADNCGADRNDSVWHVPAGGQVPGALNFIECWGLTQGDSMQGTVWVFDAADMAEVEANTGRPVTGALASKALASLTVYYLSELPDGEDTLVVENTDAMMLDDQEYTPGMRLSVGQHELAFEVANDGLVDQGELVSVTEGVECFSDGALEVGEALPCVATLEIEDDTVIDGIEFTLQSVQNINGNGIGALAYGDPITVTVPVLVLGPNAEMPGENPGTEDPGTEEPGTEEPGTEEPGTDQPGTEDPGAEEPAQGNDNGQGGTGAGDTGADQTADQSTDQSTGQAAAVPAEDLPFTGAGDVIGAALAGAGLLAAGGLMVLVRRRVGGKA